MNVLIDLDLSMNAWIETMFLVLRHLDETKFLVLIPGFSYMVVVVVQLLHRLTDDVVEVYDILFLANLEVGSIVRM